MSTEYLTANYPYVLGRGKVLVRKEADVVWYDLLHASEFILKIETEEKEHENFRAALKTVDKVAVLKAKASFSLKADVPMLDNMRRFLLAEDVAATVVTQAQAAWAAQEITIVDKGTWQFMDATGVERHHCTVSLVTTGAGPTTLVLGTDYVLDLKRGMILILPAATLTDSKVKITGNYPTLTSAHNIAQVKAGSSADVRRHIWFQGDPSDGKVQDVKGYALVRPTGDLGFIGDEWQGFGFEGGFLSHATYGALGVMYEQRGAVGDTWPVFV